MLKALDNFELELRKADEEEAAVMALVQERLDEIALRRTEIQERRDAARDDFIYSHAPEDLLDPAKAEALYRYGYDSGRGSRAFRELYEALVEDTYVSMNSSWWILPGEKSPVVEPELIMENYEPALFKHSLGLLEALYDAAVPTNATAHIRAAWAHGWGLRRVEAGWGLYQNGLLKEELPSLELAMAQLLKKRNG